MIIIKKILSKIDSAIGMRILCSHLDTGNNRKVKKIEIVNGIKISLAYTNSRMETNAITRLAAIFTESDGPESGVVIAV